MNTQKAKIAVVFGGSGFIGRHVVAQLAAAGYVVRVPSRTPASAWFLHQLGAVGQITPVACNPYDEASVRAVVADAGLIINCIGQLAESKRSSFDQVQGELPGIVARAVRVAALSAARFIHVSAIGANANSPARYARSKAAGEGVARAILPSVTILRPSIVFGPEDKFFNLFAKMALLSPVLPLILGGRTRFQPVYVGDVAAAVLRCATDTSTAGKIYELGGPAIYTFKELLQLLLRVIERQRCLLPVPEAVAKVQAKLLENLPGKLLTRDQLKLLAVDNVVAPSALGFADLGITPTAVEAILPSYLDRFRPRGRF